MSWKSSSNAPPPSRSTHGGAPLHRKMTAYETAPLAFQAPQIAMSRAGLWVATAQVGVGPLQAALIAGGLWLVHQTATARENQHHARHEETLTARAQPGEALQQPGEALHAVRERTAPRSSPLGMIDLTRHQRV